MKCSFYYLRQQTLGKFREINVRIHEINVRYSMEEVILLRLYRASFPKYFCCVPSYNINAAWTIHSPWAQFRLYSDILFEISFHLPTSASGKFWDTWEVGEGIQSRPEDTEKAESWTRWRPSWEVGNFEMPTSAVSFEPPSNLRGSGIELSVAFRSKRSFLELFLEALYIFLSR